MNSLYAGFVGSNPTRGMYDCVYSVLVLFCVQVVALRWADPRPRSPTDCVNDQETEKAAKAQHKAVEQ
jgi:hypothetical protein